MQFPPTQPHTWFHHLPLQPRQNIRPLHILPCLHHAAGWLSAHPMAGKHRRPHLPIHSRQHALYLPLACAVRLAPPLPRALCHPTPSPGTSRHLLQIYRHLPASARNPPSSANPTTPLTSPPGGAFSCPQNTSTRRCHAKVTDLSQLRHGFVRFLSRKSHRLTRVYRAMHHKRPRTQKQNATAQRKRTKKKYI